MKRMLGISLASLLIAGSAHAQGLPLAAKALGSANTQSISFSGTGIWYQFGQAPRPGTPWPAFDLTRYNADIDYETASARIQITRIQQLEAGRLRPLPVEQVVDQYVSGPTAWNRAPAPNAASGTPALVTPQPALAEERAAEIWATPQGFLRAAQSHGAKAAKKGDRTEVSFTVDGKYRYEGVINTRHEVETVRTWIGNPVTGDTLAETRFLDYKDQGGVYFPSRIVRSLGGHPVLDLQVASVKVNPVVELRVPAEASAIPVIQVTSSPLAEGVFYLAGGTHHSVALEQKDHVIVVEAPQNEARSLAVIAKVKELIPNKPIRYVLNTHEHFDHSGGLRSFVDEGAIVVTSKLNQAAYEKAWAQPRTLSPDKLAASRKKARFETFTDKLVLSDGRRSVELHALAGNGHNDAFALVWLPAEKILIEGDAYTPLPAGVKPPAVPNPYAVNLYETIQKQKLDVDQIAALHGPGVVRLADLRRFIGLD